MSGIPEIPHKSPKGVSESESANHRIGIAKEQENLMRIGVFKNE